MEPVAVCRTSNQHPNRSCTTKWKSWSTMAPSWRDRCWFDCVTARCLQDTPSAVTPRNGRPTPMKDALVNRLAKSITQLTLCQVTTSEVDAASKLLDKPEASEHSNIHRQLRQINCILDSCTISASYEVSEAQKALLLLPHTAEGASTSSEELNAQISPRTMSISSIRWRLFAGALG